MAGGAQNKTKNKENNLGRYCTKIEMENVGKDMEDHSGNYPPPPYGQPEKTTTISMSCGHELRSTDSGP